MRDALLARPYPDRVLVALALAVVALVAGLLRGGSLDSLAATDLRQGWLLAVGLGLQVVAGVWSPPWLMGARALLVLVVSNLAVVVFIALNRGVPGLLIADLGLALNLLVIVVNGAMPVSADAARAAGAEEALRTSGVEHERMDETTALSWLGDVIPVPPAREVLSIGDVLLAGGLAGLVYSRTTTTAARARRASGSRHAAVPAPRQWRRRRRPSPSR
jgi:hypothetical protein